MVLTAEECTADGFCLEPILHRSESESAPFASGTVRQLRMACCKTTACAARRRTPCQVSMLSMAPVVGTAPFCNTDTVSHPSTSLAVVDQCTRPEASPTQAANFGAALRYSRTHGRGLCACCRSACWAELRCADPTCRRCARGQVSLASAGTNAGARASSAANTLATAGTAALCVAARRTANERALAPIRCCLCTGWCAQRAHARATARKQASRVAKSSSCLGSCDNATLRDRSSVRLATWHTATSTAAPCFAGAAPRYKQRDTVMSGMQHTGALAGRSMPAR